MKSTPLYRQRLPFHPLLASGILGILAAHFSAWPSFVWLPLVVLLTALFFIFRRQPLLSLLVAATFALVQTWQSRESVGAQFAALISPTTPVEVTGIVASEPRIFSPDRSSFELRLSSFRQPDAAAHPAFTLLVDWPGPPPAYGDEIRAPGLIESLASARNPGQFDFARWSSLQGIYSRLRVHDLSHTQILAHDRGHPLVAFALQTRSWLRGTLTVGINDQTISELIIGMVLGDVSSMPQPVLEQFRGTGTFHLFSVSGLHVSIIAVIFWSLCRVVRLPRRLSVVLAIALVFFYVLLTGLKPASVRSAIMASIVLLGLMAERRPVLLNNLFAAGFLILLSNTNELFNPGFQLSFCVVAAILFLATPLTHWLEKPFQPDPFLPEPLISRPHRVLLHGGRQFSALAAVSLAAWCGSLPLTLGYFHLISLTALPANMVAVPVSFGIMAVALLSLGGGLLSPWLAAVYNQTNWLLTKILLSSVAFFASLPGSFFYVSHPDSSPPLAEIVIFDFGSGGAAWINAEGATWLIDCGSAHTHDSVLLPFLHSRGLQSLDGLILTHHDSRHIGAAASLLHSCPPRQIVDFFVLHPNLARLPHEKARQTLGLPISLLQAGDTLALSPASHVQVLYPPAGLKRAGDDLAAVLRLHIGRFRLLFLSDAGPFTEDWLLARAPDFLAADILIKGTVDSAQPADHSAFLQAVSPSVVIAAASAISARRQIDQGLASQTAALRAPLFRQDHTGAVTIRIYPERCEVSGFLNNQTLTLP